MLQTPKTNMSYVKAEKKSVFRKTSPHSLAQSQNFKNKGCLIQLFIVKYIAHKH